MSDSEYLRDDATEMLKQGQELYNSYETAQAAEVLSNLLALHPYMENSADVHYWLGMSLFNQDRMPEAEEHLAKARRLLDKTKQGFKYMDVLYHLGMCYSETEEHEKALAYLDEAEDYTHFYDVPKWYNERFLFRMLKGETYYHQGEFEKAIAQYDQASDCISEDDLHAKIKRARVDYDLGRTYHYHGDSARAWEHFSRVQTLYLEEELHENFHFAMILHHSTTNELREAIAHFERLEVLGVPRHLMSETFNLAGRIYYALGDTDKARRCLKVSECYKPSYSWIAETNRKYLKLIGDDL